MNYNLFLFIIVLFFSSCTIKKNKIETGNYIKINASLNDEDIFPESKYSINTKLIPLETSQECLIGDIQTILYRNNRFYIKSYRDNRILTFDQNGKFAGKLDLIGRGPGEYLQFNDFIVDSVNNIYILDMFEVKKYNSNFQFVESFKLKLDKELHPVSFYISKNNIYFWNHADTDQNRNENKKWLYIYSNNKLHKKHININYKDFDDKRFYDYNNKILIYPLKFDNKITKLVDEEPIVEYIIDFGKKSVPENYNSETFYSTNKRNLTEEVINQSVISSIRYPIETHNFFSFMASQNMQRFQFLYDKKFAKCYYVPFSKNNPLSIYNILGAVDSCYFSFVEPYKLKPHVKEIEKNYNPENFLEYSENSNPVIIVWTINFKGK